MYAHIYTFDISMCVCVSSEQEAGHQGAEQEGEEAGTQGHEVQL